MAVASEFDSKIMNYYSSNDNDRCFEIDGPKQMKYGFPDLDPCSPEEGIQLQISYKHYKKSFKQVVSVIVAVEKLKTVLVPCSPASLATLFSFIFEEEFIDLDDIYECDVAVLSLNCRLRDIDQKCLVMSGPYELQALHLNGENIEQQVVFSMVFVQGEISQEKIPVALGLKGNSLYLSCVMSDGKPTLQLEKTDPKLYPKKKMEKRFVFNKLQVKDKVEFESAEYPNWYISTSQMDEMPIFLGNNRGGQDITDFTMEEV
ncbi:PREDICTED: interleukin-1 beta-like [Elephantulus edwardii]|uniref:interleukin-1 beta-like n=1 Tax=Elephantulus edwardii TaxID=28737 RepID=UPI0003F0ED63|nr:PREDICTED: interleukin-1 beta-like [Elephantulus edwardii]